MDSLSGVLSKSPTERSRDELHYVVDATRQIEFFQQFSAAEHTEICRVCGLTEYHPGEIVVKEFSSWTSLFVVLSGQLSATYSCEKPDAAIPSTLKPGAVFGSVVSSGRASSKSPLVSATKATALMVLSQEEFYVALKVVRKEQPVISPNDTSELLHILANSAPNQRSEADVAAILRIVRMLTFFQHISQARLQEALCQHLTLQRVPSGTSVYQEGEHSDAVHVVLHGSVALSTTHEHLLNETQHQPVLAGTRYSGDVFGDVSVAIALPRLDSAVAIEETQLLSLDADLYRKHILEGMHGQPQAQEIMELLQHVSVFSEWSKPELCKISPYFTCRYHRKNEAVIRQGQPATAVHLLVSGECKVRKQLGSSSTSSTPRGATARPMSASLLSKRTSSSGSASKVLELAVVGAGAVFGETDVLSSRKRGRSAGAEAIAYSVSVVCYSSARTLEIPSHLFLTRLGTEVLEEFEEMAELKSHWHADRVDEGMQSLLVRPGTGSSQTRLSLATAAAPSPSTWSDVFGHSASQYSESLSFERTSRVASAPTADVDRPLTASSSSRALSSAGPFVRPLQHQQTPNTSLSSSLLDSSFASPRTPSTSGPSPRMARLTQASASTRALLGAENSGPGVPRGSVDAGSVFQVPRPPPPRPQ